MFADNGSNASVQSLGSEIDAGLATDFQTLHDVGLYTLVSRPP